MAEDQDLDLLHAGPEPASAEGAVGYCRPPVAHRFKPGQSGNPKGRPKRTRPLAKVVDDVMGHKVAVTINGHKRKVPVSEAMLMRLREKALGGDLKAIKLLLDLSAAYAPRTDEAMVDQQLLSEEDRAGPCTARLCLGRR